MKFPWCTHTGTENELVDSFTFVWSKDTAGKKYGDPINGDSHLGPPKIPTTNLSTI